MDVGICVPSHVGDIDYVVRAEALGYSHAWLADSQMLWSDCYAALALAADRTSKIKIGTGVAITGTRPAAVNAAGIATINAMAPGRTFFGVGSGNTATRIMGLPPHRIAQYDRYLSEIRPLLKGEEAQMQHGSREIPIKHVMPDKGFVNFEDTIPMYVSGFGPRSLGLAGKHGDGAVITFPSSAAMMEKIWLMLEADGEVMPDDGFAQLPPAGAVAEVSEDDYGHEVGSDSAETTDTSVPVTTEDVIAGLKGKIEQLGAVNMMAIEQFDELDTRHDFLTTQRKDLVDSIAATAEAIRRINKTTRERFRAAFDAINMHYQKTFSTLFGGGKAGLVLLDEADLLESGIEIIAQPPGKRLQSVQLLSGGEKALSAMAFMFAIFKYRPSPFCLLDEIDAPLDDVNIGRFIEMLREMVDETQFVLITHNRKTMEHADRLYGITMEEPGVSKLISVQFN